MTNKEHMLYCKGNRNISKKTAGTAETPPANKLLNVISSLISNTTREYIYNIPPFYHSISE